MTDTVSSEGLGCGDRAAIALDDVLHPVWLLGLDGSVLDLNHAAQQAVNLKRADVVGHAFWDLGWWPDHLTDPHAMREGFATALADGNARVSIEAPSPDGDAPAVDVVFNRVASHRDGDADTVMAHASPRGDDASAAASSRYVGLRRLAVGLAAAVTLDEVSAAIADLLAPAVGACFALVAHVEGEIASSGDTTLPGELLPAITAAIEGGVPVAADGAEALRAAATAAGATPDTEAPARITVHSFAAAPDVPTIAVVLGWRTPSLTLRADEDAADVLALCGAALQRAQATKQAEDLAAIMDALIHKAPIGIAYFDAGLRFVDVNQRLAAMSGMPIEDHLGRTIREIAPDLAATVEPILDAVVATGRPTDKIEIHGVVAGQPREAAIWESAFIPVADRHGVGIGVAAIVEDITERRRTHDELERLYDREREVADRLQQGMLPARLPVPEGYELATRYVAGSGGLRVGGDWYDLIELGRDRYGLVIGDVVGHGLDAALTMTTIHHALAGLCHAIAKPGPLLDRLDDFLTHDGERLIATLFYGLLEPSSGRLTFSSAGHPPALLISADGVPTPLVAGRGVPLGISGGPRDDAATVLEPGDLLLLYTDGILERRGEPFDVGLERLVAAASRRCDDLNEFAGHILEDVPDARHSDDIALLALRRRSD